MLSSDKQTLSQVQQTYNDMEAFARCQWSPLAKPLPFASTYRQREILGCTRRQQVREYSECADVHARTFI